MTLNITVLTPVVIYQSADFRLTDSATGKLVTNRSVKTVGLTYPGWGGFVTYTGLGSWEGRAVSGWIANLLGGQSDLTMAQVAELLEAQGTKVIDAVARRTDLGLFLHEHADLSPLVPAGVHVDNQPAARPEIADLVAAGRAVLLRKGRVAVRRCGRCTPPSSSPGPGTSQSCWPPRCARSRSEPRSHARSRRTRRCPPASCCALRTPPAAA